MLHIRSLWVLSYEFQVTCSSQEVSEINQKEAPSMHLETLRWSLPPLNSFYQAHQSFSSLVKRLWGFPSLGHDPWAMLLVQQPSRESLPNSKFAWGISPAEIAFVTSCKKMLGCFFLKNWLPCLSNVNNVLAKCLPLRQVACLPGVSPALFPKQPLPTLMLVLPLSMKVQGSA